MYCLLSFKHIFFYRLKKIFHNLFSIDWTWKAGVIAAFLILFVTSIFSTSTFAATSVDDLIGKGDQGALPAVLNGFSTTLVGDSPITSKYTASMADTMWKVNTTDNPTKTTSLNANPTSDIYDDKYYRYGGAVGATAFIGGAMYDFRPASTYDAVMYQANNAGLVVNAQVQGFNQFAPITVLWGLFRNIALLLFVVVFVAIGFFILIQRKIGGQETVSLVSGISNAAVAMIVITFSYAIGGIIVDIFSNVMNGVVATTFDKFINSQEILNKMYSPNSGVNVFSLMNELSNIGVSSSAANLFQTALIGLNYPAQQIKQVFGGLNIGVGPINIGAAIGLFASMFVDILMGIINNGFNNSSLINAIVSFVIFVVIIRVVFALLTAYVSLVFKIMFAPLILLPAALPGNAGKTILGWLLSLVASALTFPAIFACILLSAMFMNLNANLQPSDQQDCNYVSQYNAGNTSQIQGNVRPAKYVVVTRAGNDNSGNKTECYPLILPPKFNFWPAPLGYINGVEPDDLIRFVIALAFIVVTPTVPKMLGAALKVPQDNLFASVGQSFKGGAGMFSNLISSVPIFGVGKIVGSVVKSGSDALG